MKKQNDSKRQSSTFTDTARALGCDEHEANFDAALKRIGKAKLTHPPRPAKVKKQKPAE